MVIRDAEAVAADADDMTVENAGQADELVVDVVREVGTVEGCWHSIAQDLESGSSSDSVRSTTTVVLPSAPFGGRLLLSVSTLTTSISLSSESEDSCTSAITGNGSCQSLCKLDSDDSLEDDDEDDDDDDEDDDEVEEEEDDKGDCD